MLKLSVLIKKASLAALRGDIFLFVSLSSLI